MVQIGLQTNSSQRPPLGQWKVVVLESWSLLERLRVVIWHLLFFLFFSSGVKQFFFLQKMLSLILIKRKLVETESNDGHYESNLVSFHSTI